VGGLVVSESDEVIAIKVSGQIVRSAVAEVPAKGRDTMGVKFVGVAADDAVSVIALNPESSAEPEDEVPVDPALDEQGTVVADGQNAPIAGADAEEENGD